MQRFLLLTLLSTAAVASEPVAIKVESQPLAHRSAAKAQPRSPQLSAAAVHAMEAHVDSQGRVVYGCDNIDATQELTVEAPPVHKER